MNRSEHAKQQFRAGLNCSQAVLAEFAEDLGLDLEPAQRIACGFGAGMGRTGGICGAVTGGVMVIGLATCDHDPRSLSAKAQAYQLVSSLVEQFKAKHQSIYCHELLGCDLSTLEGYAEAESRDLFETRCPLYVESVVEMLEAILTT